MELSPSQQSYVRLPQQNVLSTWAYFSVCVLVLPVEASQPHPIFLAETFVNQLIFSSVMDAHRGASWNWFAIWWIVLLEHRFHHGTVILSFFFFSLNRSHSMCQCLQVGQRGWPKKDLTMQEHVTFDWFLSSALSISSDPFLTSHFHSTSLLPSLEHSP